MPIFTTGEAAFVLAALGVAFAAGVVLALMERVRRQ